MAKVSKVAICSLLVGLGIFTIAYWNQENPSHESSEISQGEKYDFNKSTDTVNRSSDIRYHRTMDTRPRDYDDIFEPRTPPVRGSDTTLEDRVYFNQR